MKNKSHASKYERLGTLTIKPSVCSINKNSGNVRITKLVCKLNLTNVALGALTGNLADSGLLSSFTLKF